MNTLLSPTLAVARAGDRRVTGCLGALLVDPAGGKYYALTAAQLIGRRHKELRSAVSDDIVLSQDDAKLRLGLGLDQDATAMIAASPLRTRWVDADHPAQTSAGRDPRVVSAWDLSSDRVTIHARSRPAIQARLARYDSAFAMPSPTTGEVTIFDNALEIHGLDNERLLAPGDAGALVADHNGDWLGVVIAAKGRVAFAAPLERLAAAMDLKPPSRLDLLRHNELVDLLDNEARKRLERATARRAELEKRLTEAKAKLAKSLQKEVKESKAKAERLFA